MRHPLTHRFSWGTLLSSSDLFRGGRREFYPFSKLKSQPGRDVAQLPQHLSLLRLILGVLMAGAQRRQFLPGEPDAS